MLQFLFHQNDLFFYSEEKRSITGRPNLKVAFDLHFLFSGQCSKILAAEAAKQGHPQAIAGTDNTE